MLIKHIISFTFVVVLILTLPGYIYADGREDMEKILRLLQSAEKKRHQGVPFPDPEKRIEAKSKYKIPTTWAKWVDKDRIVSSAYDDRLVIWDVTNGKPLYSLRRYTKSGTMAASPRGGIVAADVGKNSKGIAIRVWDAIDGSIIKDIIAPQEFRQYFIQNLNYSADGKHLVATYWYPKDRYSHDVHYFVVRYDTNTWKETARLMHEGNPYPNSILHVSNNGGFAVSTSEYYQKKKHTINVYNFEKNMVSEVDQNSLQIIPRVYALSGDNKVLWVGGDLRKKIGNINDVDIIGMFSLDDRKFTKIFNTGYKFSHLNNILVLDKLGWFITSGGNKVLEIRNISNGKLVTSFGNKGKYPYGIDMDMTSKRLLTSDIDSINIWDLDSIVSEK